MNGELTSDPLLEEAVSSLRKARMLISFVRETLRYPDVRRDREEVVKDAADALDDAIDSVTHAISRTADAHTILSLFLYRNLSKDEEEVKDE